MFHKAQIKVVFWMLIGTIGIQQVIAQVNVSGDPISYTVKAPENAKTGEEFTISTVFNIEPGWYIYAPIDMNIARGKIVSKVTFKVPEGIKKIGGLELPDKMVFFDTYKGNNVVMSQKFLVDENILSGKQIIQANVVYQSCNDDICYPPVRKKIDVALTIE
ncbi:MAG: protein-disulfide reductase DsbD domain-containing protein [Cellulophaga sp.]